MMVVAHEEKGKKKHGHIITNQSFYKTVILPLIITKIPL